MVARRRLIDRRRRAAVLPLGVVFAALVGVGMLAMAIDTGLMYSAKQELQNAADAAALAAASQLVEIVESESKARIEGSTFANLNRVMGTAAWIDLQSDVVLGHAVSNGEKFDFLPGMQPYDAARVTVRRNRSVRDGPVSLLFARVFGMTGADLKASATAMLAPRDIAVVIDLSGSMNDDSELRHSSDFPSDSAGTLPGVQINLEDVWAALPTGKGRNGIGNGFDPPAPGPASGSSEQPGTGSGRPDHVGGEPSSGTDRGPRWGWMTGWGSEIVLGNYGPNNDAGLYHIPRGQSTSDTDIAANVEEAGYSADERAALLSAQYDGSTSRYRNRVTVLLGLAGWRSGKDGGKYSGGPGNGDDSVDNNEIHQPAAYPFDSGSWNGFINYVKSTNTHMVRTVPAFQYQYGLKTFTNYLLEKRARHSFTPELADTPEQPLHSIKGAVRAMIDELISLQTRDQVALEAYAQYGYHLHDLIGPSDGDASGAVLLSIPDTLNEHQAGHFTSTTNIGAGLEQAVEELTGERGRSGAAKVIMLLTDGKPNVNSAGAFVGADHPAAVGWALDQSEEAKSLGTTIYTVGVGADINEELMRLISTHPVDDGGNPFYDDDGNVVTDNYFFADNSPDPENDGLPKYVAQLKEIFETLGGRRAVQLIQ